MARYKKPSKINIVSVLMFLGLAAAIYAGIFFGPAYWRKWSVSEVLDEAATPCRGNLTPPAERLEELARKAEKGIRALGIDDQHLRVHIDVSAREVTVWADYREVIHHPVIKKTTTLSFRPSVTRNRGGF